MTIEHHPTDELLTAYAAGTLDQGEHIAVATHLSYCRVCRGWVKLMESVGGSILSTLPPAAMASDALNRIEKRLNESIPAVPSVNRDANMLSDIPELPAFVRRLPAGEWTWIAPHLHLRRIVISEPANTRVFLLKSSPGIKFLPHAHTGFEMTSVLSGSFSHDGKRYSVGDFDMGDPDADHEITIGPEGDCICLVAMQGELKLKGLLGHLIQPLISI
jgi:putative transcriptional regulator